MKKQNKIIIGVILGIAAVIVLLSFLFPSVYKGLTSGTFGKAEKYRQEQMTENDIQLRSDITRDTAQLRQMITGLIYFALFTDNLSMTIDTCLVSFQLQGFDKDPKNTQAIGLLKDYNSFLKNNSKTLASTTRMLAAFLLQDTLAQSADVERNIRDFGNYVNQVNQKDSVLMLALNKVDAFMIGNKMLQKKQDEIRNLKAIRDQLVIKSTQFMALTGNKQGLGSMLSYSIQSQSQFNGIGALNVVVDAGIGQIGSLPEPSARVLGSAGTNLNVAFSASALQAGGVYSSGSLNVVYDRPNLQFLVCSSDQIKAINSKDLSSFLCGTNPNLGVIGVIDNKNLGVILNAGLLCNVLSSQTLGLVFSANQLNSIICAQDLAGAGNLQSNFGSSAALQMGLCGNQALQVVVGNNAGLQKVFNSMNAINGISSLQSLSLGVIPPSQ